jgi:hypothetical protein
MAQMKARILSVATACLLTTAAWADEPPASTSTEESSANLVGQQVRLSGPTLATRDEPLIGQVVAVDEESITVVQNARTGETRRIPFSSIKRLEIFRLGQRSRSGRGALIGTAVSLALGATALASEQCHGDDPLCHMGSTLLFVFGTPAGALIGAAIGSASKTPGLRWERVDARRVRVAVLPDFHGGVRGGLSVRF